MQLQQRLDATQRQQPDQGTFGHADGCALRCQHPARDLQVLFFAGCDGDPAVSFARLGYDSELLSAMRMERIVDRDAQNMGLLRVRC
jgi:hypothetical protein